VNWPGGVRHRKMHTAKQFLAEQNASEADVATGNLKSYKSPSVDQISAEFNRHGGGGYCVLRSIEVLSCSWTKNFLTSGRSQSLLLFTKRTTELPVVITEVLHCCKHHTKFYLVFFYVRKIHMQLKLLGITNVDLMVIENGWSDIP
jgi:hypothetical protein